LRPLSDDYGWDRGTPVDRIYIERFMGQHAGDVRGICLEVKDDAYTRRFGGDGVTEADVLDVDGANPRATVVADLVEVGSMPSGRYDCFLLNQTLHLLVDPEAGLANAWSCLAPGGVMLLTVPSLGPVDLRLAHDLWRWTPQAFDRLLARVLPDAQREVVGYGNLVTATAFLHGIAAEELAPADFARSDPRYPLVVGAWVRRP
jgi:SAM-dependent methyltransferase